MSTRSLNKQTLIENPRCNHCGWPIVPQGEAGCWESNCSMRPMPPLRTTTPPQDAEVAELRARIRRMQYCSYRELPDYLASVFEQLIAAYEGKI